MTAAIARRIGTLVVTLMCCGALHVSPAAAQQPEQSKEYVAVSELPPTEQIPASRLLIGAYAFVLVALFLYVASVGKRLGSVQREIERLETDVKRTRA